MAASISARASCISSTVTRWASMCAAARVARPARAARGGDAAAAASACPAAGEKLSRPGRAGDGAPSRPAAGGSAVDPPEPEPGGLASWGPGAGGLPPAAMSGLDELGVPFQCQEGAQARLDARVRLQVAGPAAEQGPPGPGLTDLRPLDFSCVMASRVSSVLNCAEISDIVAPNALGVGCGADPCDASARRGACRAGPATTRCGSRFRCALGRRPAALQLEKLLPSSTERAAQSSLFGRATLPRR
jgi:hypothetical protein